MSRIVATVLLVAAVLARGQGNDSTCRAGVAKGDPAYPTLARLSAWARRHGVSAHEVRLSSPKGPSQELLFVLPDGENGALDDYAGAVAMDSASFVVSKGWFAGEPGRPPFHAMARVADVVYEYGDDGRVSREPFVPLQRRLLEREDRPTTYEVVFALPGKLKSLLPRFFTDRFLRRARVGARPVAMQYDRGGWGLLSESDGSLVLRENCITFALSFCQSHWQHGYPGLTDLVETGGLSIPPEEEGRITPTYLSGLVFRARPVAILVWRRGAAAAGAGEAVWDFLTMMRAVRHYRLERDSVRLEPARLTEEEGD